MSAPTEAAGLVPAEDRRPRQRFDIKPHGTEARAMRERREGRRPCPRCLRAENAAHAYRAALRARRTGRRSAMAQPEPAYVTEVDAPAPVTVLQVLHSHMLTEPQPELEAGA